MRPGHVVISSIHNLQLWAVKWCNGDFHPYLGQPPQFMKQKAWAVNGGNGHKDGNWSEIERVKQQSVNRRRKTEAALSLTLPNWPFHAQSASTFYHAEGNISHQNK